MTERVDPYRIGLIVPSSNTTIETEIPEMFRRRAEQRPEQFTVHSSRVRMLNVTADELAAMVAGSDRSAIELADAEVDVIAYGCLVALMAQGYPNHEVAEKRLQEVAAENGSNAPVISSAGALVRSLRSIGAERVSLITPYMPALSEKVVGYIQDAGIEVLDYVSLGIERNTDVARHDPNNLIDIARGLNTDRADAVIISACVQMPSLSALAPIQEIFDVPVLSAAAATASEIFQHLGLEPGVPDAGRLLAGAGLVPATTTGKDHS